MKRKTAIPKKLPVPTSPDSAERAYYSNLRKYVNRYISILQSALKGLVPDLKEEAADEIPKATRVDSSVYAVIRMDANAEKKVGDLLAWVDEELKKAFPDSTLTKWAQSMAGHVNKGSKKNMAKVASKVGLDIEPLMHDRDLSPWVQNIVEENVGLIRSIPKTHQVTFKNGLVAMITGDAPQDQIRKMVQKNFGLTRNQARLIARDQVGKLNGKINQYRQEQLGGKRYVWKGNNDGRERKDHVRLNNTTQYWSKPPVVDKKSGRRAHPGEDFQCRCRAEMVLEDVLE